MSAKISMPATLKMEFYLEWEKTFSHDRRNVRIDKLVWSCEAVIAEELVIEASII